MAPGRLSGPRPRAGAPVPVSEGGRAAELHGRTTRTEACLLVWIQSLVTFHPRQAKGLPALLTGGGCPELGGHVEKYGVHEWIEKGLCSSCCSVSAPNASRSCCLWCCQEMFCRVSLGGAGANCRPPLSTKRGGRPSTAVCALGSGACLCAGCAWSDQRRVSVAGVLWGKGRLPWHCTGW